MQITFENLSNLERKLSVTIPAEDISNKITAKLNKIATKAKLPGFRPGKVPLAIIKNKYAESARADVLEKLLRETYVDAIQKEKMNPAGLPEIKIVSSKPDEDFVYNAFFEVYPEIKLADFTQIEVEKSIAQIVDSDVDEMLEKMRKNNATWQDVTDVSRKSKAGDQLTVDFTVKVFAADKAEEPKIEKGVKFILGDGSMWVDFERQLYELGVDEEKQFILQIPDTHMDKILAGKKVEFIVKVQKICEPILPDLNDEFAAKMNFKEGGVAKLRKEVHGHMERELEFMLRDLFKKEIMDKILELNPIDVPKVLVENELKRKAEEWKQNILRSRGTLDNAPVFPRSNFELHAKREVALRLLVMKLVKEHNITVSQQEVHKKIDDLLATYYEDKGEMLNKLLSDQKHLAEIEALLLEDKVIDHLAVLIKTIEKNVSYKDVVAKR